MKRIVALFVCAAAVALADDLKLKDGRTFQNWEIVRENSQYVTVKHAKGISQFPRHLLPGEKDPVRYTKEEEAVIIQGMRKVDAVRFIDGESLSYQMALSLDSALKPLLILAVERRTDPKIKSRIDMIALRPGDAGQAVELFGKFRRWATQSRAEKISSVHREIGSLGGEAFVFEYEHNELRSSALLRGKDDVFTESDIEQFITLLDQLPEAYTEFGEKLESAKKAALLK